jgi:hypothetical protein
MNSWWVWLCMKTDRIDAAILARLHAAAFLPEVWVAGKESLKHSITRIFGPARYEKTPAVDPVPS